MFRKKKEKRSDKTTNNPASTIAVGGPMHRFNKKKVGILLLVICLLAIAGYFKFSTKPSTPPTNVRELLQSDDSDSSRASLVQKYGVESDKATQEARNSDTAQWEKSM